VGEPHQTIFPAVTGIRYWGEINKGDYSVEISKVDKFDPYTSLQVCLNKLIPILASFPPLTSRTPLARRSPLAIERGKTSELSNSFGKKPLHAYT
jgi:hypothetical protein